MAEKPPPTPPPEEKLPITYHLTIVREPEKGSRVMSVVVTKMQGDRVVRRRILESSEDKQDALDGLNRAANRAFYFGEPEALFA